MATKSTVQEMREFLQAKREAEAPRPQPLREASNPHVKASVQALINQHDVREVLRGMVDALRDTERHFHGQETELANAYERAARLIEGTLPLMHGIFAPWD